MFDCHLPITKTVKKVKCKEDDDDDEDDNEENNEDGDKHLNFVIFFSYLIIIFDCKGGYLIVVQSIKLIDTFLLLLLLFPKRFLLYVCLWFDFESKKYISKNRNDR